ncbi:rhodanese-like domain-containing protein 9, chloroplastic isoform X2 [Cryptomeria japonica]|uniref:rhodanese-like domain-containing protein 9, chloroplastic isoform X2 n=1 Tax=Cryptomeria japonica TaxID=3369 RepID=UPI0027D9EA74|nr:rhodanese-like domain-containing protein 9, chloroplastic isoform X2 [Cryptomeria japonica]
MVGVGYVCALVDGPAASSNAFLGTPFQCRFSGRNLTKKQKLSEASRFSHLNRTLDIRAEVKFVNPDEAKKLVTEEGYTILDIRDKTQYDRAHIKSCYHAPLFIENNDSDLGTIFKRTMHNNFAGLLYGLSFTKLNSDFVPEVQQQFPPDSKLLLVCQEGLRSGVATKELEAAGYQNLAYITSGLQSVKPGTFEKEGLKELQDAGKAGLVTIQGKLYYFSQLFSPIRQRSFYR